MVYTHKWLPLGYSLHDGLNFTVNVWNASRADPNRAINWQTPLVSFQRVVFFRGSSGEMWNSAYQMVGNVSATMGGPIKLSAGEYLFSINGYMSANPAPTPATRPTSGSSRPLGTRPTSTTRSSCMWAI